MSRSVVDGDHDFTIRMCLMRASRRLPGRRQLRAEQAGFAPIHLGGDGWSFHCRAEKSKSYRIRIARLPYAFQISGSV